MKVSQLDGSTLTYWALHATGIYKDEFGLEIPFAEWNEYCGVADDPPIRFDWNMVAPFLEQLKISIVRERMRPQTVDAVIGFAENESGGWRADVVQSAPDALTAVLRCIVAQKFGDEVPDNGMELETALAEQAKEGGRHDGRT